MSNHSNPVLSIRLMTYNHSAFVHQAMDGIMMQKTSFPIEVVVGDDFSEDNTLEIIRKYKNTKNITIRILDRKTGDAYWKMRQVKGRLYNFTNILENCKGEYISLLDGDDYWTDPLKLQKQVDFLKKNPDFSICFHDCNILQNDILVDDYITKMKNQTKHIFNIYDLGKGNFIHTPSVTFRNVLSNKDYDLIRKCSIGDYPLYLSISKTGKIKRLKEIMAVYKVHDKGIWSNINKDKQRNRILNYLEILIQHFNHPVTYKFLKRYFILRIRGALGYIIKLEINRGYHEVYMLLQTLFLKGKIELLKRLKHNYEPI